jgi:hypothetical protein
VIVNDLHMSELSIVASYDYMGGAAPAEYRQWRRFEALRRARYLKLNGRRNVRWDRTFYNITDKGRQLVTSNNQRGEK